MLNQHAIQGLALAIGIRARQVGEVKTCMEERGQEAVDHCEGNKMMQRMHHATRSDAADRSGEMSVQKIKGEA